MQSKSGNIEVMNHDKTDEIMEELSESLLNRYLISKRNRSFCLKLY